jgi:hypothetical protein
MEFIVLAFLVLGFISLGIDFIKWFLSLFNNNHKVNTTSTEVKTPDNQDRSYFVEKKEPVKKVSDYTSSESSNSYSKPKTRLPEKTGNDHSESVWNRNGYTVKRGESPSYYMYGKGIYTPDQVYKKSNSRESSSRNYDYLDVDSEYGLSSNQKKVKTLGYSLVKKYASKRKAKDILVSEYGFDEETARYAAGYNGYENW